MVKFVKQYGIKLGFVILCLQHSLVIADAKDSVSIGLGLGLSDALIQSQNIQSTKVIGIGWRRGTDLFWQHGLFGYGELSIDTEWRHLRGEHENETDSLDIYAIKPVLRFYQDEAKQSNLFYEAALGIAYFTRKNYENIRLSTDTQFAMHFALGWHINASRSLQLVVGYHHYSNGYLDQPNQGLDFVLTTLQYQFD